MNKQYMPQPLSDDEKQLLEFFRRLDDDSQEAFLDLLLAIADEPEPIDLCGISAYFD